EPPLERRADELEADTVPDLVLAGGRGFKLVIEEDAVLRAFLFDAGRVEADAQPVPAREELGPAAVVGGGVKVLGAGLLAFEPDVLLGRGVGGPPDDNDTGDHEL